MDEEELVEGVVLVREEDFVENENGEEAVVVDMDEDMGLFRLLMCVIEVAVLEIPPTLDSLLLLPPLLLLPVPKVTAANVSVFHQVTLSGHLAPS